MHRYLLVVTDLFSRFAWVIPTKDQTAHTVAQALWHGVIQPFSCPQRFLSDQGASFESRLIKELCQYYSCVKSRTSAYHPQGNGTCERFNQTLLNLLGALEKDRQDNWVEALPELVKAYNTTVHASTGFTPHYVMFGAHARLPVDLVQGTWVNREQVSVEDWVQRHHQRLVGAYQKVAEHAAQSVARQGKYQKDTQPCPLVPGERVLIRTFRRGEEGKLADRWEPVPHVVVQQLPSGIPVYKIKPEGREGPTRTVHQNHLKPCLFQPKSSPAVVEPPARIPSPGEQWPFWTMGAPQDTLVGLPLAGVEGRGVTMSADAGGFGLVTEGGIRRSQRANRGKPPDRYR